MKAITIRNPYAWLVVHGDKDIENRSWPTSYRGPLLIHAGVKLHERRPRFPVCAEALVAPRGGFIGIVDLVNVTRGDDACSRWAEPGHFHWHLANPRPVDFVPARGAQGIYVPPSYVLDELGLLAAA